MASENYFGSTPAKICNLLDSDQFGDFFEQKFFKIKKTLQPDHSYAFRHFHERFSFLNIFISQILSRRPWTFSL